MLYQANNTFYGSLTINGAKVQPNASGVLDKLSSGLRIRGEEAAQGDAASLDLTEAANNAAPAGDTLKNTAAEAKPCSIISNFANEMLKRCSASSKDEKASKLLADSLAGTAREIENKFGAEKANEFMSKILDATDAGLNENGIAAAMSQVFSGLAAEAQNDAAALSKLNQFRDFLNSGLDSIFNETEENQAVTKRAGLSFALNQFFGNKSKMAEDGFSVTAKGFNSNFERTEITVERQQETLGGMIALGAGNPNAINTAAIAADDDTLNSIADYLRNTVGNSEAADYISQKSGDLMGGVATAMAIVAMENGQEAAYGFEQFLNSQVSPGVSSDGFGLRGWRLGRDYSQDGAPAPGPGLDPETAKAEDLFFGDAGIEESLAAKKHQGLTTNWTNIKPSSSGARAFRTDTVDLNELYAQYLASRSLAGLGPRQLNNPSGNLISITV